MGGRTFFVRYYIIIMLLTVSLLAPINIVMGDGIGDYPPPENGDWIIANETSISNEEIIVEGDLRVLANATLTLKNVDLRINSTSGDLNGIYVEQGGTLRVYDSNITNLSGPYIITIFGNMTLESSTVINMMYGIDLEYGNVYIGNCTISNNNQFNHYGIRVNGSALLYNNYIHSHKRGITLNFGAHPDIINNTINFNEYGILSIAYGFPNIIGNNISNNVIDGISAELGHYEIHSNIIASNGEFGIKSDHASIKASNNSIYDNGRWGIFTWGAPLNIHNNTYVSHGKYNAEGDVLLEWDVIIEVYDQNEEPLENVYLNITDSLGNVIWNGTTISHVRTFVLRDYEIIKDNTLIDHNPYTINATKGNSSTSMLVDIEESQIISIIIEIEETEDAQERIVKEYEFPVWGIMTVIGIWVFVLILVIIGIIMSIRFNSRRRK